MAPTQNPLRWHKCYRPREICKPIYPKNALNALSWPGWYNPHNTLQIVMSWVIKILHGCRGIFIPQVFIPELECFEHHECTIERKSHFD